MEAIEVDYGSHSHTGPPKYSHPVKSYNHKLYFIVLFMIHNQKVFYKCEVEGKLNGLVKDARYYHRLILALKFSIGLPVKIT